jgi:hypothetical protein
MASNQTNEAGRVAICRMPPGALVNCNTCGRPFTLTPSQIKRRDRKCSPCVDAGRALRGKPRQIKPSARRHRMDIVRNKVKRAIESGKLVRLPCEVCDSTSRVVAHHEDYTKPLQVKWLCTLHHWAEHKALTARGWVSNV